MSKTPKKKSNQPKRVEVAEPEVLTPVNSAPPKSGVLRQTTVTQTWNAPFLPPQIMKQYDTVVPDGAARLFKIFEDETKHRREMELKSLDYQGRSLMAGKPYALAYALAVLSVVGYAIYSKSPWVAVVLGGGMLTTVALGFFRSLGDGPLFGRGEKKSTDKNKPESEL